MARTRGDGNGFVGKRILYASALVGACAVLWNYQVCKHLLEPYLDEVFHVRQAQVYCSGDFKTWDSKITTPPGLYMTSYLIYLQSGLCNLVTLRTANIGPFFIFPFLLYRLLELIHFVNEPKGDEPLRCWGNLERLAHTAANIALFPPLFFFSGMYYTDVQSVFAVLMAYYTVQSYRRAGRLGALSASIILVALGTSTLWFRQTNIFWVAIFPAGLAVADFAQKCGQNPTLGYSKGSTFTDVVRRSWKEAAFYDPPVENAWIEDYAKTALSIVIITLFNLKKMTPILSPYIVLLGLFASFVIWNGGVVLGDKSNHIVTLHLPQMLYLWPYMIFFSFPIAVAPLFNTLSSLLANGAGRRQGRLPRLWVLILVSIIAATVVHFNTIVHPFTLADNRHYVFYVFRLLLRHSAVKYLAAPAYIACGYLVIQSLGTSGARGASAQQTTSSTERRKVSAGDKPSQEFEPCRASFVLVWLATTALSLITAPLVEPRYCIVPWIMWRLHVPIQQSTTSTKEKKAESWSLWLLGSLQEDTSRLIIETAWFCCINLVMGYLFLHHGFEWPQEPGKVQRFMW